MGGHLKSALICVMAALLTAVGCGAAEFPARPVHLVVPYAAGGPTDVIGRLVADYLARDLKQVAIVENKPGALASVPDFLRYGALIVGFIVFMLTKRSIFAGVVSGEFLMLAGKWWLG